MITGMTVMQCRSTVTVTLIGTGPVGPEAAREVCDRECASVTVSVSVSKCRGAALEDLID